MIFNNKFQNKIKEMAKILFFPVFAGIIFSIVLISCESNDNPQNSTYIPQPVNKKVLVEYFSNSGCQPCIAAHRYFIEPVEGAVGQTINDTAVIFLSWQYLYPNTGDSIYHHNPAQNSWRANYYSVLGAPDGRLDGSYMGSFSAPDWTNLVNTEFKTTKYLNISLSITYDTIGKTGSVTANVQTLVSPSTNDNIIYFILAESKVNYITAPNGIKQYNDVMRRVINDTLGQSITLTQGGTATMTNNFDITDTTFNDKNCSTIVFVQSKSTQQVYGVEKKYVRQ